MSLQNVEIIQRRLDAFNRGDIASVIALTDRDAVWWDRADDPGAAVYRGRDACVRHLAEIAEDAELRIEALDYIDSGDSVVMPVRLVGRGRSSGVPFDETEVHVFTLRGGLVIETREYRELGEALEAVGPAQQAAAEPAATAAGRTVRAS
jgi:ketosteroid isomerase-like protein